MNKAIVVLSVLLASSAFCQYFYGGGDDMNSTNNAYCPAWSPYFVPSNEYALSAECKQQRRAQRDASNDCPQWNPQVYIPVSNLSAACNAERDRQRKEWARQSAPRYVP